MNTTKHLSGPAVLACAAAAASAAVSLLLPATAVAAPAVPPKNISTTDSLGFGRFAVVGGGTISMGISGARTHTGGVVLLASTATPASFSIASQGNDNKVYVLSLPANGSVTLASGANRMPVNHFVSSFTSGSPLPGGAQTVIVGATLQVAPSQGPGTYSGSFHVTLEYQ